MQDLSHPNRVAAFWIGNPSVDYNIVGEKLTIVGEGRGITGGDFCFDGRDDTIRCAERDGRWYSFPFVFYSIRMSAALCSEIYALRKILLLWWSR